MGQSLGTLRVRYYCDALHVLLITLEARVDGGLIDVDCADAQRGAQSANSSQFEGLSFFRSQIYVMGSCVLVSFATSEWQTNRS